MSAKFEFRATNPNERRKNYKTLIIYIIYTAYDFRGREFRGGWLYLWRGIEDLSEERIEDLLGEKS